MPPERCDHVAEPNGLSLHAGDAGGMRSTSSARGNLMCRFILVESAIRPNLVVALLEHGGYESSSFPGHRARAD